MNVIDFMRLFKGYVCFTASGGFSERFINLCFSSGIHIWNISAENKEIKANIKPKDFKKLKEIRKNAGVKIKITGKRGLPFYLKRHRDRAGLLIAIAFFAVFMVVMNRFVWCIESVGSEKFSAEEILSVAEEMGLKYGTFVPFFDEREASRKIVNAFDGELLWASVNIKGSRAMVEVRDFVKGIDENYNNEPCNIVSDSDGVVISLEVSKGQGAIEPGSGVSKGDLLISGVIDTKDMSAAYCHAKGEVTALVNKNCTAYENTEKAIESFNKSQSYYSLYIFGLKIPLGFYKTESPHSIFSYMKYLSFDGKKLPFGIIKTTVAEYENKTANDTNSVLNAVSSYTDKSYSMFADSTVLSSVINVDISGEKVTLSGNYECLDFIGKEQPIIIENG